MLAASIGAVGCGILRFHLTEPDLFDALVIGGGIGALVALCLLLAARAPVWVKLIAISVGVLLLSSAPTLSVSTMGVAFGRLWRRDRVSYEAFVHYVFFDSGGPKLGDERSWVRTTIDGKNLSALPVGNGLRPYDVLWIPVSGMQDSQLGLYYVQTGSAPTGCHPLSVRWCYGSGP